MASTFDTSRRFTLNAPPAYNDATHYQAGTYAFSQGESSNNAVHRADERPNRQSQKTAYALSLQKACDVALRKLKSNSIIATSEWVDPLTTAPEAISIMAILLKAADQEAAAGLQIESQEVTISNGTVVGKLPSKYFHTNLQHCSDIGRMAFLDAQHEMSAIHAMARSLIADEGSIGYIIELLEDLEEARYQLKPELEALKKTSKKCLDSATSIAEKFRYWYLVINHLKQTSLSKNQEVIKEKEVVGSKKQEASDNRFKYKEAERALKDKIRQVRLKLDQAEHGVARAQKEVDRLRDEPIVPEPTALEDLQSLRKMLPTQAASLKERGLITDIKDAIWGQSKKHSDEDAAALQAYYIRVQKQQDEALQHAREQRQRQRDLAAQRLQDARAHEDRTLQDLVALHDELSNSASQLAEARANLSKARGEMMMLCNKELELVGIMNILDNSNRELGRLKDKIEPLVDFFTDLWKEVDHNVDVNLGAFLRPIMNGIQEGTNPGEVEAIRLGRLGKERMMSTALQMQGRFSAIADISAAYVTVSTEYIRPAIRDMESLSCLTDSEWTVRSQEFIKRCEKVVADISNVAQGARANVDNNAKRHIDALQRRAIEAVNERED